jgi:hypothetical protein
MLLAQAQVAQFSGREGARIYVVPTGCAIDPVTGWPRSFQPLSAAVVRDAIASVTYSALGLGYAGGTIANVADTGWLIKMGPPGGGFWRFAAESDGFAWRSTDSIHYGNGAIQVAEAIWALIKNFG